MGKAYVIQRPNVNNTLQKDVIHYHNKWNERRADNEIQSTGHPHLSVGALMGLSWVGRRRVALLNVGLPVRLLIGLVPVASLVCHDAGGLSLRATTG